MRKHFVGLPVVIIFSIIMLIGVVGFIWESLDVGYFVPFAFITSIAIPFILEIILVIIFCQYIIIDNRGIKKYFFGKILKEFTWLEIHEIRAQQGAIYISKEELIGQVKQWNRKKYIYLMYSDSLALDIKKYALVQIKINF